MSRGPELGPCDVCPSSDAKAVYEDGHSYCFSCGTYKAGSAIKRIRKPNPDSLPTLPFKRRYATIEAEPLQWLQQYRLTEQEMEQFKWDPWNRKLVMEIGEFQNARNFASLGPKYLSTGVKPYPICGKGSTLYMVEDAVSWLKVARTEACMCLFGSYVPLDKLPLGSYSRMALWLDPDKRIASARIVKTLVDMGIEAHSILTAKDPKDEL